MHEARHTQVNPKQRQHTKAALETSLVCGKYILKYKGFVNWGGGAAYGGKKEAGQTAGRPQLREPRSPSNFYDIEFEVLL